MSGQEATNRQRIWPLLWRERYVILASVVVMIGLAVAYTLTSPKVYQASAILEVNLATANPGSTDTTNANQGLAQNYATLLVSSGFLQQIHRQVDGGKLSADALGSRLSASSLPTSALVQLKATGASPDEATRIAGQVANAFINELRQSAAGRTAQLQAQLEGQIAALTSRITALDATGTRVAAEQVRSLTASRQALINQIGSLVATGLEQGTSANLSAAPAASATPISPRKSLNLIAGLLLGLLLGVGVAWARETLRPAVHSAEDVASLLDLAVLASVPLETPYDPQDPAVREAYGVLHANLTFALRASDLRVVTIVGHDPGVGKSSVVEGLARAAARRDRRVLMVDGDMRAASLSMRFGQRNMPGVVDVLQGAIKPDLATVSVGDGLHLLPTRRSLINPASLLSGNQAVAMIAELRAEFDLVVIDSPPLSGLADGLLLATLSDLVVFVVRAGLTKPADLTAAAASLSQNMAPVAGFVMFEELQSQPYYGAPQPEPERKRRPRLLSH